MYIYMYIYIVDCVPHYLVKHGSLSNGPIGPMPPYKGWETSRETSQTGCMVCSP